MCLKVVSTQFSTGFSVVFAVVRICRASTVLYFIPDSSGDYFLEVRKVSESCETFLL